MKLTVDELLQLVHDAIATESDSFGKKAALRRLTRLRVNIATMNQLKVDIPTPEVKGLPENPPKVKPEPVAVAPAVVKSKKTRKKRVTAKERSPDTADTAVSAQTNWEV